MSTAGSGGAAKSPSRNVAVGKFEGGVPVRPEEGVMDVEAAEEHDDDDIEAESMQLQMETVPRVKGGERFTRTEAVG